MIITVKKAKKKHFKKKTIKFTETNLRALSKFISIICREQQWKQAFFIFPKHSVSIMFPLNVKSLHDVKIKASNKSRLACIFSGLFFFVKIFHVNNDAG